MQQIDEPRLKEDLQYRYDFLRDFIGFGAEDVALIQQSAIHLGPRISELVEQTYERLLAFDSTARHFVPRQSGFAGASPPDLASLSTDHPAIQFRKDHLNRYFAQLISRNYDAKMILFLDTVGKMHTVQAGNSEIHVPLVQMNALMGLISDILIQAIAEWIPDTETSTRTIRAFTKLMWIQNDFVNRHYAVH